VSTAAIRRLGGDPNAVVVQLEGRQHPGVVIQADSLRNLGLLLSEADTAMVLGQLDQARALINEVRDLIRSLERSVEEFSGR
jgi:hypothetical protein